MAYSDNSVKTMPNSTKRRPEMDFTCHFPDKNGYRSLVAQCYQLIHYSEGHF